ncbi:MAG: type I methionyl aminopeptidase, partial [Planctomycetaceae bacterium]|nr:type I methionyl aminopeptidase [Planctomycetaceae bacterium]
MLTYKSAEEIRKMRVAGLCVWHALQIARLNVRAGITTADLELSIAKFYEDVGAIPLFKGVPGRVPFPAVNCISVNEEVVHGIPSNRKINEGDIVSVDTGCKIDGWCGDSAVTIPVGEITDVKRRLLDVTERVLQIAIEEMPKCKMWHEVGTKMETFVHKNGFSVVEDLVGHGIGKNMHEPPQVPNFFAKDLVNKGGDFAIKPGLVIAVEPMVNVGTKQVRVLSDHWTIITCDHKPSAHFEHTLAVTESGIVVLTGSPQTEDERMNI